MTIYHGVPVRELNLPSGAVVKYVLTADMPPEIAERFEKDVVPCAGVSAPEGFGFYAHDWERWCNGNYVLWP